MKLTTEPRTAPWATGMAAMTRSTAREGPIGSRNRCPLAGAFSGALSGREARTARTHRAVAASMARLAVNTASKSKRRTSSSARAGPAAPATIPAEPRMPSECAIRSGGEHSELMAMMAVVATPQPIPFSARSRSTGHPALPTR